MTTSFQTPVSASPGRPDPADMRQLICTRCITVVEVFELPTRYLDPLSFVCGQCEVGE